MHGQSVAQFLSSFLRENSGMNCEEKSIDCDTQDELDSVANGTSEGTAADQDNLFLWSWFIVFGIVLVGLISNLIVIHAICFVKRFHRFVRNKFGEFSVFSVCFG